VRRSGQARKQLHRYSPPKFCSNFALSTTKEEPRTIKEAIDLIEGELWKKAMEEEMESLRMNDTWDLVAFPNGRRKVSSKSVIKRNTNATGRIEKFKAQLVSKGYSQVEGLDFGEIFSLVAKLTSIRVLMSLVATSDLEIEKMYAKTAFLHIYIYEAT